MKTLRIPLLGALAALLASAGAHAQQLNQPYRAMISQSSAQVLSGPGNDFYATAELTKGSLVEVYRSTGEFLAIRPPRGSFSLAAAADIDITEPGVGVVSREGMASRVGSSLSDDRDAVHVRFNRGERVQVLGRITKDGVKLLKLAPPAGEFRWVRADAVKPVGELAAQPPVMVEPAAASPVELAAESPPAVQPPVDQPQTQEPVIPQVIEAPAPTVASTHEPATFEADSAPLALWVDPATHEQPEPGSPRPATPISPSSKPAAAASAAPAATSEATPSSTPPAATTPTPIPQPAAQPPVTVQPRAAASGDFYGRLRQLEVELAHRVSGPAEGWRLDDLQGRALGLQNLAKDETQRAAAGSLAMRANRFTAIAQRQREMQPTPGRYTRTKLSPAPAPAMAAGNSNSIVGELRTVVSKRPDAPKFAIIDSQGRVVTLLTPQPGMDLSPVIGKQVEVSGVQGYLPAIRSRHVAATRVAQLPPRTAIR